MEHDVVPEFSTSTSPLRGTKEACTTAMLRREGTTLTLVKPTVATILELSRAFHLPPLHPDTGNAATSNSPQYRECDVAKAVYKFQAMGNEEAEEPLGKLGQVETLSVSSTTTSPPPGNLESASMQSSSVYMALGGHSDPQQLRSAHNLVDLETVRSALATPD